MPGGKLAEQGARTRQQLLQATLNLLAKHGFHGISLDLIAAEVGVTKGAIYGNFESKDALIVAALASQPDRAMHGFVWPTGRTGEVRARLRKLGQAMLDGQGGGKTRNTAAISSAEFLLYALTHEDMRNRLHEIAPLGPTHMSEQILELFAPEELPMPVASFAWLLSSLFQGLSFARALAPRPPTDEQILAIFEGLAGEPISKSRRKSLT
jgi:AcrR family transcriptional regulator